MAKHIPEYTFIDTPKQLQAFADQHRQSPWLAFDTEFVGERRYQTLLCLIQVGSEHGNFIIDPIAIDDLGPFLDLIAHPKIMKITHAGENDYRLLAELFGVVPQNLFDIQVAAGFCGYRYPMSYSKLVEAEIGEHIKKDYSVADWESRPMPREQVQYALNDIIHLPPMYQSLWAKLTETGRTDWVRQELRAWETPGYFDRDPDKEILGSNLIHKLSKRKQVFLIRLLRWRDNTARERNQSRDMVFPSKLIGALTKSISSGRKSLFNNRRINNKIVKKYGHLFSDFYEDPAQEEELDLLKRLPKIPDDNPEYELILDMLYLMVKYRCLKEDLSVSLVFPRGELKQMKLDPDYHSEQLNTEWRSEFLGKEVLEWIQERSRLEIDFGEGKIHLYLK